MKAIIQDRYGSPDTLEFTEIDPPGTGDDEVLVRVRAASVHADVWHAMTGQPYVLRILGSGLRKPKNRVPGTDVAGHVESVGTKVTRFRPGDEVFGQSFVGNLWRHGGAFAEFAAIPEYRLEPKPAGITFEQAAAVPTSGSLAVQGVRDEGRTQPGQKVLFTRRGERYDFILDLAGNHPWSECKRALTPDGTYVLSGYDQFGSSGHRWFGSLGRFAKLIVVSPFVSYLHPFRGINDPGDRLVVLKELIEARKITPVIDKTFPLSDVPEAIRYLETGQVRGKVVITV